MIQTPTVRTICLAVALLAPASFAQDAKADLEALKKSGEELQANRPAAAVVCGGTRSLKGLWYRYRCMRQPDSGAPPGSTQRPFRAKTPAS